MDRLRGSMRMLGLSLTAAVGLMLAGCGEGEGSEGREYITMGTAPSGGTFYAVGSAIAGVVNAEGPAGWTVAAESTGGSMENIRLLLGGDLAFAISNASITWHAYHRRDEWADLPGGGETLPIVNMMTMFPNLALFITRADSDIETIGDLRGRRVYVGPEGAGFEYFIRPILAAHDLTYDDIRPVYGSQDAAVDYLGDGSVAAAMIGGGIPNPAIVRASNSMRLHFIPFGEEEKASLIEEYPFFEAAVIPKEDAEGRQIYRGLEEDFHGLNVGSAHLVTTAGMDENVVYEAVKTIYEHRSAIAERHGAARGINEGNVIKDFGVPFHPGAVRYYQEIGIWPEEREVQ